MRRERKVTGLEEEKRETSTKRVHPGPIDGEASDDESAEPKITVKMNKSLKRQRSLNSTWQHRPIKESILKIGQFVLVNGGQEGMLGKIIGKQGTRWTAHRWKARSQVDKGFGRRFFPVWTKDGQLFTTANPPRSSSPVHFDFSSDDVECSGFNLFNSVPDELAVDFADRNSITVAMLSRSDDSWLDLD